MAVQPDGEIFFRGQLIPQEAIDAANEILAGKHDHSPAVYLRNNKKIAKMLPEKAIWDAMRYIVYQEGVAANDERIAMTPLERRMAILETTLEFAKQNVRLSYKLMMMKPEEPILKASWDLAKAYKRFVEHQMNSVVGL